MTLKAILFDVDGTLAETEEAHRAAFNRAFKEAGKRWHWSQDTYRALLKVTGGQQRLRHFAAQIGESLPADAVDRIHRRKNGIYAELVAAGEVRLRPGVARLVEEARSVGVRLGIATTTSTANIAALLDSTFPAGAIDWFDVIVAGEDVAAKKPDPEVYVRALVTLALPASACVAIEDSRNGLLAARRSGITTLVTPSFYTNDEDFSGAADVRDNLDAPTPVTLAALRHLVRASIDQGASGLETAR